MTVCASLLENGIYSTVDTPSAVIVLELNTQTKKYLKLGQKQTPYLSQSLQKLSRQILMPMQEMFFKIFLFRLTCLKEPMLLS